jgi:2-C-methyl-D-erythritol 4-phosphate cytidylyltransferase
VDWAVETARISSDGVVVVLPTEQAQREGGVAGGATRSASVRCGLAAVPSDATIICVHDAARPFASEFLFDEVIDAVCSGADGAVPGLPVVDTIKFIDSTNIVTSTPDRRQLVAVQTPQAFRAKQLRQAHENNPEGTDDSTLVEARGGKIVVITGDPLNRKITTPEDLNWARAISRGEV